MTPAERIRLQQADTPALHAELAAVAHVIWQQHYVPLIGQAQVDYMLARRYSDEAPARDQAAGVRFTLARKGARSVGYSAVAPPRPKRPRCWTSYTCCRMHAT